MIAGELETEDPIDVGVAAGHEDDARIAGRLDLLGELETVPVWQLHVEETRSARARSAWRHSAQVPAPTTSKLFSLK